MGVAWSQMYPPAATFTEKNVPTQKGRVFIITGGYSGIGYELVRMLYGTGATVYVAGRSEGIAREAIDRIKAVDPAPSNPGRLEFLFVDLSDLATIKPAVQDFKSKETRLDVLWNNAGISQVDVGSKSKQGHELTMATNCLGTSLLTELLLPVLEDTARQSNPGNVRVLWLGSQMIDFGAPKGGLDMKQVTEPPRDSTANYTNSKTGNWFLSTEFGKRVDEKGILSLCLNPGGLKTNILRNAPIMNMMVSWWLLHPPEKGAYTELFAGLSPDITMANQGEYIIPWGRMHPSPRPDLLAAMKSTENGGTGEAQVFLDWCRERTRDYA